MKTQAIDYSVNLMRSILWQHEGAPKAVALARADQDYIDRTHSKFWSDWYRDVFDLTTANAFGLTVWARILDIAINVNVDASAEDDIFGFSPDDVNYDHGIFGIPANETNTLDTESARSLLLIRYFSLSMRPTVPAINRMLHRVFGGNPKAWVQDNEDMTMAIMFEKEPSYQLREILKKMDVLPRPAGVKLTWAVQPREAFGFGDEHLSFEQGSFLE